MRSKIYYRASFTVEASFIMPIILFLLVDMFYLTMAFVDRCTIQSYLDQMTLCVCMLNQPDDTFHILEPEEISIENLLGDEFILIPQSISTQMKSKIESMLSLNILKKCMVIRELSIELVQSGYDVRISAVAKVNAPFLLGRGSLIRDINIYGVSKQYNPEQTIRVSDLGYGILKESSLYDKLNTRLGDILDYIW